MGALQIYIDVDVDVEAKNLSVLDGQRKHEIRLILRIFKSGE